ncbi:S-methyl-5-thioadenosine phosphorylase [Tulasnella sp. 419]|nr:S-methyl-5-thioadenosine phosphorylase [Tulasnella sp. 418]KAG8967598.1 S-methyl-5-thioadenosine phosphorylase [Tulasnella sp. 419]
MVNQSASPVLVGVIGGSGLYKLENLTPIKEINPETPWGFPSSPITIAALPSGVQVAFLSRHGTGHNIPPSAVPSRANIAALKQLGVRAVLAFSAVGSLREEIRPGDFVIPSQIIDRTKGIRPASFFEGTNIVAHAMFGDPFDSQLARLIEPLVRKVLNDDGVGVKLHCDRTLVVMEGPQFSTRAESNMYRSWGGDIINMSTLPEAKLAREAELSYVVIATATDYDCWRVGEAPVTVAEVIKTLTTNAETSKRVAATILQDISDAILKGDVLTEVTGSMQFSIVTSQHIQSVEDRRNLGYILPYFISDQNVDEQE